MKNIAFILIALVILIGCKNNSKDSTDGASIAGKYGDTTWVAENALSMQAMLDTLAGKDSIYTTVKGKISEACQAKGCWMSMEANGQELLVQFKDYAFFVPKNSAEHNATLRGWAYSDTLSVAEQIELAKDSEKTAKEIAEITEPKVKLSFMADGVIIE